MVNALWEKWVFCNWFCFSIFKLHWTLATHYIYTPWMLMDKLHELQSCNSPYIWSNSLQLIATHLQLCQNNSFSTTMQLHYNCTHDVMLKSLFVIHILKSNTWHYEDFWTLKKKIRNIYLHCPLWLLMMVWDCDTWHNWKFPHGILIIFLNKYIYIFIYFSS